MRLMDSSIHRDDHSGLFPPHFSRPCLKRFLGPGDHADLETWRPVILVGHHKQPPRYRPPIAVRTGTIGQLLVGYVHDRTQG